MNKKDIISVIIVDDHPVVSEGIIALLKDQKNMKVIDYFTNARDTLTFLEHHSVDILLLDITLPDMNGDELCLKIKDQYPTICILVISNHNERSMISRILRNGASGYLLKNSSVEEITKAITDAVEGNISLGKEVQSILIQNEGKEEKIPRLTRREREVLKWVAEGLTTDEIAAKLIISPLTIETHRRNMKQKFKVNNTASLIKKAVEQKLL